MIVFRIIVVAINKILGIFGLRVVRKRIHDQNRSEIQALRKIISSIGLRNTDKIPTKIYLNSITQDTMLKALLKRYLNGDFKDPIGQSVLRLALSKTEPEVSAATHLRNITQDSTLNPTRTLKVRSAALI